MAVLSSEQEILQQILSGRGMSGVGEIGNPPLPEDIQVAGSFGAPGTLEQLGNKLTEDFDSATNFLASDPLKNFGPPVSWIDYLGPKNPLMNLIHGPIMNRVFRDAHENMNSIIEEAEYSSILSELMDQWNYVQEGQAGFEGKFGQADETDPSILGGLIGETHKVDQKILSEHGLLQNFLRGDVSEEGGGKRTYMYGIDEKELEQRKSEIARYPSYTDDDGIKRYTIPLAIEGSWPPESIKETRSMQHWLEDYPLWEPRSSINNP